MGTIYTKNGDSLIEMPGRAVSTYESGLLRVDQKFVCPTSSAAQNRTLLAPGNSLPGNDSYPAADGLFIYPAPQETRDGNGFTEFSVSAYGRTTTSLPDPVLTPTTTQFNYGNDESNNPVGIFTFDYNSLLYKTVIPYGNRENLRNINNYEVELCVPFNVFFRSTSVTLTPSNSGSFGYSNLIYEAFTYQIFNTIYTSTQTMFVVRPRVKVLSQRNFGNFVEVDILVSREGIIANWQTV